MLWFTIYFLAEQLAISLTVATLLRWVLKREKKADPQCTHGVSKKQPVILSH